MVKTLNMRYILLTYFEVQSTIFLTIDTMMYSSSLKFIYVAYGNFIPIKQQLFISFQPLATTGLFLALTCVTILDIPCNWDCAVFILTNSQQKLRSCFNLRKKDWNRLHQVFIPSPVLIRVIWSTLFLHQLHLAKS